MNLFLRTLNRNKKTIALVTGFLGLLIALVTLGIRGCEFSQTVKPPSQTRP